MIETEIKNFFSIAQTKIELIEQVKNLYSREVAKRFNSFDFWRIGENKVSEIIAFFLDPKESHEQGDVYLRHFLKKFEFEFFDFDEDDTIEVKCELPTIKGRKIDIAIIKNNFEKVIAIENKIYSNTPDQNNQIQDYLDFFKEKDSSSFCLIYLSPIEKTISGRSITSTEKELNIESNRLKFLTYEEHMIDCLSDFGNLTKNNRVESFLNDFENTLRKMYMGQNDINSKEFIIKLINENLQNLEISFIVSNSLLEIKNKLKKQFEKDLIDIGKDLGLVVQGTALIPSQWKKHKISFTYERGGVLYGLQRINEDKSKTRIPEIDLFLENEIKEKFYVSPWWPMYQHFYSNIDTNKQFWLDIKSGRAKERAKHFVKLIIDNFNNNNY